MAISMSHLIFLHNYIIPIKEKMKITHLFITSAIVSSAIAGGIRGGARINQKRAFLNSRDTIATSSNDGRRKLNSRTVNAFLRENHNPPQYIQQQNSMLLFIKKIKPETRNDPIEVYTLPSTDPFAGEGILGRLEGLNPVESRFHTNAGYYLPMNTIDPNYESLGYGAIAFVDQLDSDPLITADAYTYSENHIPQGTLRGVMGLVGEVDAIFTLKVSPRRIPFNQIDNYKGQICIFLNVLNPDKRIDPEAFKPLLQDDDDTPIGRLNGLVGEPTKFQNDEVYISMEFNEPNFDTIYTSTYMDMIDLLDFQIDKRAAVASFSYNPKLKDGSIVGLMGELGTAGKLEPFLLSDTIDRIASYYSKDETLSLLDLVSQPSRVDNEKYSLPSHMTDPEAPTLLGRLQGKIPDDGIHVYSREILKYGVNLNDKKIPSMTTGTSTGARGISTAFFSTLDKIPVSKYSGVGSLAQINLTGIDHDIQIHVEPVRTSVCGSSYGSCTIQSMAHTSPTATAGVRCCSDAENTGWSMGASCAVWSESLIDGTCPGNVTYDVAFEICDDQSGRLCTGTELIENDCAAGTGCELDHSMVWSLSGIF